MDSACSMPPPAPASVAGGRSNRSSLAGLLGRPSFGPNSLQQLPGPHLQQQQHQHQQYYMQHVAGAAADGAPRARATLLGSSQGGAMAGDSEEGEDQSLQVHHGPSGHIHIHR
jgi:hypothetical protein